MLSLARAVRRPLTLLVALTLGLTLAACGGSDDTTEAPGDDVTLTVGVPRNFGYLSTMWAKNVQPMLPIECRSAPPASMQQVAA